MNAIDLLKKQHDNTRDALRELAEQERLDPMELRLLADELVAHMVIEEHVFYPRVRELAEDLVSESYEEHAVARFELARVMMAKPQDQQARMKVLKELVEQHLEEEETELLPKVQRSISSEELERLGARMEPMFEKAVEAGLEKLVVSTDQSLRGDGARAAAGRGNGSRAARAAAGRGRRARPAARGRAAHAR